MYLFSRSVKLSGTFRQSMPWVAEITAYVNEHSNFDASVWQAMFGYPLGTIAWSARVDSRAALAASFEQLSTDEGYWEIADKGIELTEGDLVDSLSQLVHGEPGESAPPVGAVAQVVSAVAAPGRLVDAIGWAATIADQYTAVSGAPISVYTSAYGSFGGVTWIGLFADMAAVDAATDAVNADAAYLTGVDQGGALFVPGSGHQALLSRVM